MCLGFRDWGLGFRGLGFRVCCDVAVQDAGVNDPSSAWLHARCCHGLNVEGH